MHDPKALFEPLTAGDLTLPNRILMAPLTRCRAVDHRIPNDLMVEYYRQRAGASLILSEATAIDPMGVGYASTPGIWNDEQVEGWRRVTTAVHKAGGRIMLQLWHVGRVSDPCFLDGRQPVAPSAIALDGHISRVRPVRPYPVPRALGTDEIPEIVAAYARATRLAREAGFDGVEIHGANGYLIDQFLQASSNHRTDAYGGSIENRSRFLLEVTDACIAAWAPGRVAVHLAPRGGEDPDHDPTGEKLFTHAARELGKRRVAFICAREPVSEDWLGPRLKKAFGGIYIANQALTPETATDLVHSGVVDAVAFGRLFIANPDLPERIARGASLNEPDADTFYGDGPAGYTDYPFLTPGGSDQGHKADGE